MTTPALTDEQIDNCLPMGMAQFTTLCGPRELRSFARAIEAAVRDGQERDAEFEVHTEDGVIVATACGQREQAWAEINHYAAQYLQDGPVTIHEVTRRQVAAWKPYRRSRADDPLQRLRQLRHQSPPARPRRVGPRPL